MIVIKLMISNGIIELVIEPGGQNLDYLRLELYLHGFGPDILDWGGRFSYLATTNARVVIGLVIESEDTIQNIFRLNPTCCI